MQTHPPTHPDPTPPPRGGVGTLGQIAPNQTNPPTHRPQTPPPWGRTTLKQKSAAGSSSRCPAPMHITCGSVHFFNGVEIRDSKKPPTPEDLLVSFEFI